jgi:hypothetical protein
MNCRSRCLVGLILAILCATVYALTIHPGVGDGDAAELQFCSAVLGICHPPGYPFVILAGKLFIALPLGGDAAWRVNVMTATFGVLGVLFLYGAIVRMTGSTLAGALGGLTLAFSSIYWSHSIAAEVYSFCGALLLAGLYFATRFFLDGRPAWLYVAAALLGACIVSRASEVFVLPAFVLAWFAFRNTARLSTARIAIAAICAAVPLGVTLAYYAWRENPVNLHARDDAWRDKAVDDEPLSHELSGGAWLDDALHYSLGLKWTTRAPTIDGQFAWDADKYAWLLSGAGAVCDRFSESDQSTWLKRIAQGRGASIGALGLVVAALGCWLARRNWGWIALGAGMFIGNTIFYFWHHPPDNLEFTLPGLAGLSILAALGAAGQSEPQAQARRSLHDNSESVHAASSSHRPGLQSKIKNQKSKISLIYRAAALTIPAFLLFGNFTKVSESTPEAAKVVAEHNALADAPWPRGAFIVAPYPRAMTCRYALHIRAARTDLRVISVPGWYSPEQRARLGDVLAEQTDPVFLSASLFDPAGAQAAARRTPAEIARHGFFRLPKE